MKYTDFLILVNSNQYAIWAWFLKQRGTTKNLQKYTAQPILVNLKYVPNNEITKETFVGWALVTGITTS
jgi:hypothetical protein